MKAFPCISIMLTTLTCLPANELSQQDAKAQILNITAQRQDALQSRAQATFKNLKITRGNLNMPLLVKEFGSAPRGKRKLWISMHGGGSAPAEVNDSQWQNQIKLYQPNEGVYVAPRAPTNTWDLWQQSHIDDFFQQLIEDAVVYYGVDPDQVYIMGYSAGGDGTWQLAPRMADRWAAASMMAGHPGDMSLKSLRNLPFGIFCGGNDAAYKRNALCAEYGKSLEALHQQDPDGYQSYIRIYPGLGHWMQLKDAEVIPWLEGFKRTTWPKKIVWVQDDVAHDRFYWLKLPSSDALKKGACVTATVSGQTIRIEGDIPTNFTVRLSDELINLNEPITFKVGSQSFEPKKLKRDTAVIKACLNERFDPHACATAEWTYPPQKK